VSYTVTLSPSGEQFKVNQQETVLDAALRQNIGLPYGCQGGACGACAATLKTGQVQYENGEPSALAGAGDNACLTCQATLTEDIALTVKTASSDEVIEIQNLPCKVIEKTLLCHDVVKITLKLPDDKRLPFKAGQYLNIILEDKRTRAFSIANAPHNDELIELHIRHVEGGSFTDVVFNDLNEKDILRIEAPFGSFMFQDDSANPVIMVAGGTGFAPLKAMVEHLIYTDIKNPVLFYWGVRSKRDLYHLELAEQWAAEHDNIQFMAVLSEPDNDWQGRKGFVHEAVLKDYPNLSIFDIYMAGPPIMCQSAKKAFLAADLTESNLFSDPFEYSND